MSDSGLIRMSRELLLAALSGGAGEIPTWVIDRITSLQEEEEVEAGRRLFGAGEPVEVIYYMREGRLEASRAGAVPWIYEGRWVVGAWDAAAERPFSRTGAALTNLSLSKLRAEDWFDVLEDSFDLARAVVMNAVRTVAALEAQLWASQSQPRGRTISTVVRECGATSFVDRLATFAEIGFLRGAGIQVVADVVGLVAERTLAPGEMLWTRGEPGEGLWLVMEGEVVATRADPGLAVTFGPGSAVAGSAALGDPALAWDARAVTQSRVLSLQREDWFDLMEEHFDMVRAALGALALVREEILEQLAPASGALVLR